LIKKIVENIKKRLAKVRREGAQNLVIDAIRVNREISFWRSLNSSLEFLNGKRIVCPGEGT